MPGIRLYAIKGPPDAGPDREFCRYPTAMGRVSRRPGAGSGSLVERGQLVPGCANAASSASGVVATASVKTLVATICPAKAIRSTSVLAG